MNSKKIKGFTLVELVVVMAIISILAGIMSLAIIGFRRDSKIETMNENARLVFTAFQDILIECEISQDKTIFDAYDYYGEGLEGTVGEIRGAWVFFRISNKDANGNVMQNPGNGLGDEIHINTMYTNNAPNGMGGGPLTGLSVWAPGSDAAAAASYGYVNHTYANYGADNGAHLWEKINKAVTGRIDPSMEGTYCVQMDLDNYEVVSVVCRDLVGGKDPKTGLWDDAEVSAGTIALGNYAVKADYLTPIGGSEYQLPLGAAFMKNVNTEKDIAKEHNVYVGSYPLFDNMYSAYH